MGCDQLSRHSLHCGINQGINLDSIKSGGAGIQFKISLPHEDRLDTLLVYLDCRQTLGCQPAGMEFTPAFASKPTVTRQTSCP
jgi:hypothetical protein